MSNVFFSDWAGVGRTVIAGVCAYVLLVLLLRISGKRTLSKMNAFDFVVTVALGSTLATILVSRDLSVTSGIAALTTLAGLQYLVAWTSTRSRALREMSRSEPRLLLRRGRMLHGAMRAERVNADDVLAVLRKHGLSDVSQAEAVVLETDGTFTVIESIAAGVSTLEPVRGFHRDSSRTE
jgi:uncharacterized membrane protein YcaP (DUF421 family)